MDAPNEYRIRLLAIAIHGMKNEDAEKLLRFMPTEYGLRIRAKLDELGQVTQEELDQAVLTIDELLKENELEQEPKAATNPSPELSQPPEQEGVIFDRNVGIEDHPVEAMVEVLRKERPIVVATILKHLPSRLGQSIVQQLELEQAKAALDWIPRLETMTPRAIEGVMNDFKLQVRLMGTKLESRYQGQEKLRELLAVLQTSGVHPATREGESTTNSGRLDSSPVRSSNGLPTTDLSFGRHSGTKEVAVNPSTSRPFVIPLNRKSTREEALEPLLKLDDLDLLRVLYKHNSDEVKSFLAGSNKAMRLRIEKLTHPKAVKQLRNELASAPIADEKTWLDLADRFTETALQLHNDSPTEDDQRIPA